MLDIGQVGTEMLYWTVGSRELDGGLMCTASHNPKAYTGAKLVGRGALRAVRRRRHRRAARHRARRRPRRRPPSRPASTDTEDVGDAFREEALGCIDPGAVEPMKVVLDGGNGMAGPDGRPDPRLAAARAGRSSTGSPNGEFPDHEPNPLLEENRKVRHREGALGGRRPGHRLGRRRRPLLLHRRHRQVRGRRLPHRAPGGVDPGQGARRHDPLRRARHPRGARRAWRRAGGTRR